ncbi:MAG: hypothetical protein II857_10585 [Selenomonadaceae bacterium]|nr:hypothetical protein [Selenomonadaceae bacterium]
MVKFFPEQNYIRRMNPSSGEQILLRFLDDYLGSLSGEFEIFFSCTFK